MHQASNSAGAKLGLVGQNCSASQPGRKPRRVSHLAPPQPKHSQPQYLIRAVDADAEQCYAMLCIPLMFTFKLGCVLMNCSHRVLCP